MPTKAQLEDIIEELREALRDLAGVLDRERISRRSLERQIAGIRPPPPETAEFRSGLAGMEGVYAFVDTRAPLGAGVPRRPFTNTPIGARAEADAENVRNAVRISHATIPGTTGGRITLSVDAIATPTPRVYEPEATTITIRRESELEAPKELTRWQLIEIE